MFFKLDSFFKNEMDVSVAAEMMHYCPPMPFEAVHLKLKKNLISFPFLKGFWKIWGSEIQQLVSDFNTLKLVFFHYNMDFHLLGV